LRIILVFFALVLFTLLFFAFRFLAMRLPLQLFEPSQTT
jgi:high-affinity Fe2+/Pb2+ permease